LYRREVEDSISFAHQDHAFFTEAKARHLLESVNRFIGAPASLSALDVGCGVGVTHQYLTGAFRRLAGVDISEAELEVAARTNPTVDYAASNGETLPYADATFDVTFAICVLHHVESPARSRFIAEIARVTRASGLLLIFEHNPLNPLTRLAVSRCAFDEDAVLVNQRSLRHLMRATGLIICDARYILFFPWRASVLRSTERMLRRFPLGAQYYVAARRRNTA
jgi:SAM-dependent methyltransferase